MSSAIENNHELYYAMFREVFVCLICRLVMYNRHYTDVIVTTVASQITSLTVVCSIVYSGADQRKHESSASLAFVWGIHRGPVNSPHKWPVTRKMFPFDDVIMVTGAVAVHTRRRDFLICLWRMEINCVPCVAFTAVFNNKADYSPPLWDFQSVVYTGRVMDVRLSCCLVL